jgi:hypothetical protein
MENFDIEKISRETPYYLPKDTFKTMQSDVLKKTLNMRQAPIFNLKWVYLMAAIVLLIVGANFLIRTSVKKDNLENVQLISKNEIILHQNKMAQTFVNPNHETVQKNENSQNKNFEDASDLTSVPVSHLIVKKQPSNNVNLATANNLKGNPPTEAQIDEVLDSFSSSEIASLSNDTEQDVYLDLYN